MYVWEQLHVQGWRIIDHARRMQKLQIRTLLREGPRLQGGYSGGIIAVPEYRYTNF